MLHTSLTRWCIGCGLTGATRTSLSRGLHLAGGPLSRRTGHYRPSGLISRRPGPAGESPSATVASRAGAERAGADRGIDSGWEPNSGWAALDVNRADPVEVELASDMQTSALSHVAGSTCRKYEGQFRMFVSWCCSLLEPRIPLPALDASVAMYLQSVDNDAKSFAPVKAASAAIAFFRKVNLFDHEPTQCSAACLVRNAAMRKFGLKPKNRKEPFEWDNVVLFAEAYGVRHQGIATMAGIMLGAMSCVVP
jgi:hypothetical protein